MNEETLKRDAARFARRASEVALCLDFDGTLAPVVPDPTHARPFEGIVSLLVQLARRYAGVALVSGRPAAFLAEHAAADGVRYLGLYGLQEIRDGQVWVDPRLTAARPAVVAATADLQADPAVVGSGAFLEDKEYAIAVHTRRIAEPQRWTKAIDTAVSAIALRRGLEIIPGKLVWELRPAVTGNKGDAVRRIVSESNASGLVVVGDDLGDVPAFDAAELLASAGHDVLRVAVRSGEAPPELLTRADAVVDGPAGVRDFLAMLLAAPAQSVAGESIEHPHHDGGDFTLQRSNR